MKEKQVEISRRELLKMASPLGKVTLEKARCTGCGLCVLSCPTGAMTFTSDDERNVYQMQHGLCVACGQCVEVCPEHCLQLERSLELDGLNQPASVLFEDEVVRCTGCGNPFAPKAMITSIKTKLPKSGRPPDSTLELCPECKIRANFNTVGKLG
jgi:ferredoxin